MFGLRFALLSFFLLFITGIAKQILLLLTLDGLAKRALRRFSGLGVVAYGG